MIGLNLHAKETADKNNSNELNEDMIKLKIEEMTFKFKTKIASLLK